MTIQERLRRSNFIMLVVPVLIAGMLLLIGLGALLALLETIYLPRLGMTLQELHDPGGEAGTGVPMAEVVPSSVWSGRVPCPAGRRGSGACPWGDGSVRRPPGGNVAERTPDVCGKTLAINWKRPSRVGGPFAVSWLNYRPPAA